jgi:dTMP kinase
VYYLRADVKQLVSRVVLGRGAFDYWESGMDMRFGNNMFDSFVKYQTRLIRALDVMAKKYDFVTVDASRPSDVIFQDLQKHISRLNLKTMRNAPRINGVTRSNGANGAKRPRKT